MRKIGEKAFKKNRVVGSVLCGAAALAFSLGGICVKSSVGISPMALNSGRCMIAAALTGGVCKLKNHRLHGTISVWIGAFALCLTGIFYIFSARLSSAANAIILQYTSPAFIALALCRNKESRPSFQKLCWVALVLVGTVVCCGTAGGESAVGNLFGILSGAAFAGVFLAGSMEGADALSACFFGELLAAVSGLPFLLREQPAGAALGAMLLMGLVQTGGAYLLLAAGLKRLDALTANLICASEPVLNPLWVALLCAEFPTRSTVVGGVAVLVGVVAFQCEGRPRRLPGRVTLFF